MNVEIVNKREQASLHDQIFYTNILNIKIYSNKQQQRVDKKDKRKRSKRDNNNCVETYIAREKVSFLSLLWLFVFVSSEPPRWPNDSYDILLVRLQ